MSTLTEYQSLLMDFSPRPITNEREYRRALKYLEKNIEPTPSKAKAMLLDLLATVVADYEEKRHPLPDMQPGELLEFLLDQRDLSRAELGRQAGIPRQKITNAINETTPLSKGNAIKLAEYFQLQPSGVRGINAGHSDPSASHQHVLLDAREGVFVEGDVLVGAARPGPVLPHAGGDQLVPYLGLGVGVPGAAHRVG
jgi:HTH-type transcriptional regulator/antitoxin HigA